MGIVAILLVLEATRRTIGAALPIVAIVFLLYGFAGPWLFGWLYHRGLSLELTVDQTFFTTEGIFGVPMSVAATYVILFIIFGTFLERSGAGQYGSLLPALLITMVAGIILGMGMPTTPAYIMQAALLVPAIMKLGVEPMAAHMFAFYFSCLSAVTPPVALAVYAAASIGGAGLWASGVQAMKFAAAGFIVPFFFIYNPALLFQGPWPEILRAVVTGTIGVIALAASLEGYFLRVATWFERVLFFVAAMLLIDPNAVTDVIGLGLLGVGLLVQKVWIPRSAKPREAST